MSVKTQARFGVEYHADPKVITFHVRTEISQVPHAVFTRTFKDNDFFGRIGQNGQQLVKELFEVDGVTEVTLRNYDVTVKIAKMFEFEGRDDLLIHFKWIIGKVVGLQPEEQPEVFKPFIPDDDDYFDNHP